MFYSFLITRSVLYSWSDKKLDLILFNLVLHSPQSYRHCTIISAFLHDLLILLRNLIISNIHDFDRYPLVRTDWVPHFSMSTESRLVEIVLNWRHYNIQMWFDLQQPCFPLNVACRRLKLFSLLVEANIHFGDIFYKFNSSYKCVYLYNDYQT